MRYLFAISLAALLAAPAQARTSHTLIAPKEFILVCTVDKEAGVLRCRLQEY